MRAQETVGKDAAFQKTPELALDERWQRAIAFAGAVEKRLELLGDDTVEDRLVGPAGGVGARENASARTEA